MLIIVIVVIKGEKCCATTEEVCFILWHFHERENQKKKNKKITLPFPHKKKKISKRTNAKKCLKIDVKSCKTQTATVRKSGFRADIPRASRCFLLFQEKRRKGSCSSRCSRWPRSRSLSYFYPCRHIHYTYIYIIIILSLHIYVSLPLWSTIFFSFFFF